MPRKLFRIKNIFAVCVALLCLILIYFFYINGSSDQFIVVKSLEPYDSDEFIVVKAVDPFDDEKISPTTLVDFTNFQYKIRPDVTLCNNFEDDLLGILECITLRRYTIFDIYFGI